MKTWRVQGCGVSDQYMSVQIPVHLSFTGSETLGKVFNALELGFLLGTIEINKRAF